MPMTSPFKHEEFASPLCCKKFIHAHAHMFDPGPDYVASPYSCHAYWLSTFADQNLRDFIHACAAQHLIESGRLRLQSSALQHRLEYPACQTGSTPTNMPPLFMQIKCAQPLGEAPPLAGLAKYSQFHGCRAASQV